MVNDRTLSFTTEQFDSGDAHAFVRVYTDNPDKFPGTWGEIWYFDLSDQHWKVQIFHPEAEDYRDAIHN